MRINRVMAAFVLSAVVLGLAFTMRASQAQDGAERPEIRALTLIDLGNLLADEATKQPSLGE